MTDPRMTADERARVAGLLRQTRDDFLVTAGSVTDIQWNFRPGRDRWSIGLIAEHLGLVERGLFSRVEHALEGAVNPGWESVLEKNVLIEQMLQDRGTPRDAPERVVPTGTVGREEVLVIFREHRVRSLAFAETTAAQLKTHTLDHHRPVFGTLNAFQWLLYIPLHNQRHIEQIVEIQAAPDYPSGN